MEEKVEKKWNCKHLVLYNMLEFLLSCRKVLQVGGLDAINMENFEKLTIIVSSL
jgi:hypothetical protein